MTTIAFPLLTEDFGNGVAIQFTTGGGVGLLCPGNAVDFGEAFDSVTFVMSLYAVGGTKLPSVTAVASTDTFTYTAHGMANDTQVEVHANAPGVALPGGIAEGGRYFVVSSATNTFKLAATVGGSAIDVTSDGTASVFTDIPTTFKIGAKFQALQANTASGMFQKRRWFDLSAYNVAAMVEEGVGWGTTGASGALNSPADGGFGYIADQSSSLAVPITAVRTVRNFGHGVRLALDLPATGGVSPRACLSIVAYAHAKD